MVVIMTGLPRKYAKLGFKRGWALFKRKKPAYRKSKQIKVQHMARRKRYFKRSNGMKGFSFGKIFDVVIGAASAALYEAYISPFIPLSGMIKNLLEMVAGIFLATSRGMPKMVRSFGTALAIVNAYALIAPYFSGSSSSSNFE
jgi:hypothetical protein